MYDKSFYLFFSEISCKKIVFYIFNLFSHEAPIEEPPIYYLLLVSLKSIMFKYTR